MNRFTNFNLAMIFNLHIGHFNCLFYRHTNRKFGSAAMVACAYLLFFSQLTFAQQANLGCNNETNWTKTSFPGLTVTPVSAGATGTQVTGEASIVDAATDNFATMTLVSSRSGVITCLNTTTASASVRVNDTQAYPLGNYVGFILSEDLSDYNSVTVSALNGITAVSSTTDPLISDLGNGTYEVGFVTKGAGTFNGISLALTLNAPNTCGTDTKSVKVYNAFQVKYCGNTVLPTNTALNASLPDFNVSTSSSGGNILTIATLGGVTNEANAISRSETDYASVISVLTSLGEKYFQVKDNVRTYPAGTFAGFEISRADLLNVGLLGSITIQARLNGAVVDSETGSNLLLSGDLLASGSRNVVGFISEAAFNEIRIVFAGVNVGAGETRIYNAVFERFAEEAPLVCNAPVNVTNPDYAVFVEPAHTGIDAVVCAACTISNAQSVVDGSSTDDFTTLVLGVSAGSNGRFSVKNAVTNYPAGTYSGFDISLSTLLDVNALNAIRIRTYLNGTETSKSVSPGYSGTRLLVGAGLINASGRQFVGVVAEETFDEVQIEFTNLAAVGLGTIRIHNAVLQQMCNNDPIVCGTTGRLVSPAQPVVIESSRTGLTGVCALCQVENAGNVVSASATDFARMQITAGALGNASIAVKNGILDYDAGSTVGFAIRDLHNIIQLNLFESIRLSTFLNGVPTGDVATGNALISLDLLVPIISSGSGIYYIGFVPSKPFDEVRITLSSLAGVVNEIQVYSAFVKPFAEGCATPVLTFNDIPKTGYVSTAYNSNATPVPVASYTGEGEVYAVAEGTGFNTLPPGLAINASTGVISGTPVGPRGSYSFLVQVRDSNGTLIGQRTYTITIEDALPVTLVSFTAEKEGRTANLRWVTSEEINSAQFDVEQSSDGKSWMKIGSKPAATASKVFQYYAFTDHNPLFGDNFYRLKMIDRDGTFAYSRMQVLRFGEDTESALYPNPVVDSDLLKINVKSWKDVKTVRLINAQGKIISEPGREFASGMNIRHLQSGMYLIQIVSLDGSVKTYKFIKQ